MPAGRLVTGGYPFGDQLGAGVIDGESPIEAAAREMREEANLEFSNPVLIHPRGIPPLRGGTSERIALVYGNVDTSKAGGHMARVRTKITLVVVQPVQAFLERARSGAIEDFKTLLAGFWRRGTPEALSRTGWARAATSSATFASCRNDTAAATGRNDPESCA